MERERKRNREIEGERERETETWGNERECFCLRVGEEDGERA